MNMGVQGTEPVRRCAGMFLLNEVKLRFLTVRLVYYYITAVVHIQFTPICKIFFSVGLNAPLGASRRC
jgi:hypothetical protein